MDRRRWAWLGLAGVVGISVVAWRVEVLAHPQGESDFLDYVHTAVPLAMALLLLWLAIVAPLRGWKQRVALVVRGAVAFGAWYHVVFFGLVERYCTWNMSTTLPWRLYPYLIFIFIPITPILFADLFRCWGIPVTWKRVLLAVGLYIAAFPVSALALRLGLEDGDSVFDAIRLGLVIPFFMVGIAILALPSGARSADSQSDGARGETAD